MNRSPILVIGKHGKTGARVNQRLQALGYETRAVSRSTVPAFDWEDPMTWPTAIKGTHSAYVTYQPDLAVPRAEATMKHFFQVAADHGLEHGVLLSGRGEEGAERAERILQDCGISWNIVRCSWFAQNFSENFMIDGIMSGELVLPASVTVEPFVDADDIADVAVTCLIDAKHRNRLYELTGPRALNFAQCVQEISEALGRPIKYTTVPVDDYIEQLRQQGISEEYCWLIRELFTVVFDGRNTQVMTGVEQVLGRPATDFKDYLQKTVASGVWDLANQKANAD